MYINKQTKAKAGFSPKSIQHTAMLDDITIKKNLQFLCTYM